MKSHKGFTIIEVMIVLVIVAVIILIVFLVVPTVRRVDRNNRRKKDVGYVLPIVFEEKVNNTNQFPGNCNNAQTTCFLYDLPLAYYSNDGSTTIRTVSYARRLTPWGQPPTDQQLNPNDTGVYNSFGSSWQHTEIVQLRTWTKCAENGEFTGEGAAPNDIAAQFVVETGGGGQLQCVEY